MNLAHGENKVKRQTAINENTSNTSMRNEDTVSGEKYFSSDSISSQEYDLTGQRHEEVLSFFRPRRSIITSITSLDNYREVTAESRGGDVRH